MYGSSEQNINFPTPIPVHITYQTAFVDDAGKLEIRKDVYGRDGTLRELLKGGNRAMAEIPVEHSQPAYSTQPEGAAHAGEQQRSELFAHAVRRRPQPPPQPLAPVKRPRRSSGPR